MSQASWSSPTSQSSLTSRISETTRAKLGVAGLVGGDQRVDARRRRRGARGSCRRRPGRRRARRCGAPRGPSESEISFSDGRRPAHSSPYCRSRKNSSVSRLGARPGVEHRLAVLDDEHGVAGLVAGEVGVRGVGAEPVVGVVGRAPCRCRPGAPAARPGTPRPAAARRARGVRRRSGARGRSSSRSPQPVAHERGVGLGDRRVVGLGLVRSAVGSRAWLGSARSRRHCYAAQRVRASACRIGFRHARHAAATASPSRSW